MSDQVLVIDDSLPMYRLVESHLSEGDVCCIPAYDGEKGIKLAESRQPGLVLLDVDLPDTDGFDVCQRLRSNPRTAQIPVIFLTADFNAADKARGMDLGAIDYITKPCNFSDLTNSVNAALRQRRLKDRREMRDGLTGLSNLIHLHQQLPASITQARDAQQPLSCIVAEIDDLPQINEKYGHAVGDQLITTVGHIFESQCLADDLLCAGDDGRFVLLCSAVDRHSASKIAGRLAAQVDWKLGNSEEVEGGVTCCFGVADIAVASGDTLFERACSALLRAQENGNGSISIARPDRSRPQRAAGGRQASETRYRPYRQGPGGARSESSLERSNHAA